VTVRTLATIGIAGPIVFAAAVLLQDIIQYDYLVANGDDPWTTSPVSINALGPYGWIQVLNFGVMGLSVLALAVGAHRGIRGASRSMLGRRSWLCGVSSGSSRCFPSNGKFTRSVASCTGSHS
jgi:hypothetical protein